MKRRLVTLRRIVRASIAAAAAAFPCLASADPVSLMAFAGSALMATKGYFTIGLVLSATAMVAGTTNARRQMRAQAAAARAAYNASLSDRTATMLRTDPPWRVVMGRCTVGGDIVAMFTSDKTGTRPDGSTYTRPDALRHLVIHVATHEVQAIHEMTIAGVPVGPVDANGWATSADWSSTNDEVRDRDIPTGGSITETAPVTVIGAWTSSSLAAVAGIDSNPPVAGSYTISNGGLTINNTAGEPIRVNYSLGATRSVVRLARYLGTTTQAADPYLLSVVPARWGATDNLPGLAYVVVTLDLEDPRFQGGDVDFAFDVSGVRVLDPRDGQTRWTANPALLARHFLLAEYGFGCATDEVDDTYVIAAANACDAIVTLSGGANLLDHTETLTGWTAEGVTVATGGTAPNGYMLDTGNLRRIVETSTSAVHRLRRSVALDTSATHCLQALVSRHAGARNVTLRIVDTAGGQGVSATFNIATGKVATQGATGTGAVGGATIASIGDGWYLVWVSGRPSGSGTVSCDAVVEMTSGTTAGSYAGDGSSSLGLTCLQLTRGSSPSDYIPRTTAPQQRRYTCNGAFDSDQAREGVLEEIARSMAGDIVPSAQWLVLAGVSAAPVMTLTDDDLHGSIEVAQNGVGINDLINTVRGQYMPLGARAARDYIPYSNATFVAADGRTLATDRTWQFVNADYRASQLARIEVERNRDAQIITYPAKLKAVGLRIGDRVSVTSAEYGFTSKLFRVEDYTFGLTSPVTLSLREDVAAIWDLQDANQLDQAINTELPDPWTVAAPTGVTAASGTVHLHRLGDGTVVPRVRVSWAALTGPYLTGGQGRVEIQWRRVGRDAANAWQLVSVPADETGAYLLGVGEGDAALIGVTVINALGARSLTAWGTHVVVGKTAAPTAVAGLTATVVPGAVRLSWTACPDLDYAATELRRGATSGSAVRLDTGAAGQSLDVVGTSYDWAWPATGSYTVWARHRDTSGNVSAWVSLGITVTPAAIQISAGQLRTVDTGGAINPDPYPQDPSAWTFSPPSAGSLVGDPNAPGGRAIESALGQSLEVATAQRFTVEPGKSYRLEAWLAGNPGSTGRAFIGMAWFDQNGVFMQSNVAVGSGGAGNPSGWSNGNYSYIPSAFNVIPSGSYVRHSVEFGPAGSNEPALIPAGARQMAWVALLNTEPNGAVRQYVGSIKIMEKAGTTLLAANAATDLSQITARSGSVNVAMPAVSPITFRRVRNLESVVWTNNTSETVAVQVEAYAAVQWTAGDYTSIDFQAVTSTTALADNQSEAADAARTIVTATDTSGEVQISLIDAVNVAPGASIYVYLRASRVLAPGEDVSGSYKSASLRIAGIKR